MKKFNQLNIHLERIKGSEKVKLNYKIEGKPFQSEDHFLNYTEVSHFIDEAEKYYYNETIGDLQQIGHALYRWLDGTHRFIDRAIAECESDKLLLLAFSGSVELLHLPWELLHDGKTWFIQKYQPQILPIRLITGKRSQRPPQNRALEVVFMATSPRAVKPELQFEREEARILETTRNFPMNLEVEESGNLEELKILLNQIGETNVDIVHLSGHALNHPHPCFLTEDEYGEAHYADADDFDRTFQNHRPSLLFLSGCHTGGARKSGAIPSLAGDLVEKGFPAVLGWAKPVLDITAIVAASHLYESLSQGVSLPAAVHHAVNQMLKDSDRYPGWHLLRLYANGHVQENLITPGNHKKRKRKAVQHFLDPVEQKIKVPHKSEFIGRRRKIQDCLRILRRDNEKVGVLIYGMGGYGKSSLASRVCDRLERFFKPVVLIGKLSKEVFLSELRGNLDVSSRKVLEEQYDEELDYLIKMIFESADLDRQLLFVLDDFEQNFEVDGDGQPVMHGDFPVLLPEAVDFMDRLLQGIDAYEKDDRPPKVVVTSRYNFKGKGAHLLESIALTRFADGEWERFIDRKHFEGLADAKTEKQCLDIADGNPRLLEWLIAVLKNTDKGREDLLKVLQEKEKKFREDILARHLYEAQGEDTRALLHGLRCFKIPVPLSALESYTGHLDAGSLLKSAADISLVDYYAYFLDEAKAHYRLSEIIKKILPEVSKNEYSKAADVLMKAWSALHSETQFLELTRLGIMGAHTAVLEDAGVEYIRILVDQQRYREAVHWGTKVLDTLPENYSLLLALGRANLVLGHTDTALDSFEHAQKCTSDDRLRSILMNEMASIFRQRGDVDKAMKMYEDALQILERIGDEKGKSATLHSMASIFRQRGDVDKAMKMYEDALQIKERIGDEKGKSATLHEMAYIFLQRGDVDKAMKMYEDALQIDHRIGDEQGKSATLHEMAYIFLQRGDVDKAMKMYEDALQIDHRIGDEQGKSATLHEMAYIFRQRGDVDKAMKMYEDALQIKERIGDEQGKSATLHEMAYIFRQRGDVDKAMKMYEDALQILERIGDEQGKSATLHEMAYIFRQRGDVDKAMKMYEDALQIKERIGDEQGKSATLHSMAYIFRQRGDVDKAMKMYEDALQIDHKIGDLYGQAMTCGMLAQVLAESKGDYQRAWSLMKKAMSILSHLKSPEIEKLQPMAMQVLLMKLEKELPAEQFLTMKEKMEKGTLNLEWLSEQGIDF